MSSGFDIVMENRKELVNRLIEQMEKGYASTREAWIKSCIGRPYNPVSNVVYKAGNRFRLMLAAEAYGFKDPRWITFKQAAEKGYKVGVGAKGVLLEKWIFHKDVPVLDENKQPVLDTFGKPLMERVELKNPIVNYFRVFNGEQIFGIPELKQKEVTKDAYTKMAERFEKSSVCPVLYEQQDRAYYSVAEDKIHLPPKEAFKNNETRLSVLLHEMSHSTGHPDRLNRSLKNVFGSAEYAKEELNAELGAVFLESELGITLEQDSEMLKDHSNYLKSWIGALKEDPNELFRACATAEQITSFLMERYESQKSMEMNEKSCETENKRFDEYVDKRNAFIIQLADMNVSVVERATEDIQKGIYKETWIGRAVSESNPRDYYELRLECDDQKEMIEIKQWIVKNNEAIDLQESAMYISDMKADCRRAFVESTYQSSSHITDMIERNFDWGVFSGHNSLKVYFSYEMGQFQAHEKSLEEMNYISEDVKNTGFKPTEKLVNSIIEFSKAEGRHYTLKELAELHHNTPNFKDNPRKQKCFEQIVKECQEQEMQKTSFLKNQMQTEQTMVQGM